MNIRISLSLKAWVSIALAVLLIAVYLFVYVIVGGPEYLSHFLNEPFGGRDYTDDNWTYVYV